MVRAINMDKNKIFKEIKAELDIEEEDENITNSNNEYLMKEFVKELDIEVHKKYNSIFDIVADTGVTSFTYLVQLKEEILSKYGLNKDIDFEVVVYPNEAKIKYLYKMVEMKPDNYWSRPTPYHEVTTLQMLQECIKQDTCTPDIKYLERGESELNKNK